MVGTKIATHILICSYSYYKCKFSYCQYLHKIGR
nr:MAG TPA: hypothetical protein [Caudoviricetes sp.]